MARLSDDRLTRLLAILRNAKRGDLAAQVEISGDVNTRGMGEVLMAVEELVAARTIVDAIASLYFSDLTYEDGGRTYCRFCDAEAYVAWDEDAGGNRFVDSESSEIPHADDCLYVAAQQLKAGTP